MAIQVSEAPKGGGPLRLIIGVAIAAIAAYVAWKYFIEDSASGPQAEGVTGGITIVLPENVTNAANVPWSGADYDTLYDQLYTDLSSDVVPDPITVQDDSGLDFDVYTDIYGDPSGIATLDIPITRHVPGDIEGVPDTTSVDIPVYDIEGFDEPTLVQVPVGRKPRLVAYE